VSATHLARPIERGAALPRPRKCPTAPYFPSS
jgi:hypothetical protein